MRFTKMQGAGNDYVYVDCFQSPAPRDPAGLARRIADRHFGVGGDGLILICPSERAHARMRMFNADGSESEMCGNGIRCVAKYVYDHGLAKKPRLTIETGRGALTLDLDVQHGKVARVTVDMGSPVLEPARIPTTLPGPRVVDHPLQLSNLVPHFSMMTERWMVTCISMGNPHAVIYTSDVTKVPLESVGPVLENWEKFPKRANIHFVQVHSPSEVTMRTWERGSGVTLACGTGACAVAVAGVLSGRTQRKLLAHLPGGNLELYWTEQDNHVYMTGPATEVFTGDWPEGP
jgi:diaminopimelate epimerase